MRRINSYLFGWICPLLFCLGCSKNADSDLILEDKTEQEVALIRRGKAVYITACTACHHLNPKLEGSLGPAVAFSSLELLEARILHENYPENYKPKRSTKLMVKLPHYKEDIPSLHAYLNALR